MPDISLEAIYINRRHEELRYALEYQLPRADIATVVLLSDCPRCGAHTLRTELSVYTDGSGNLFGPGLVILKRFPLRLAACQAIAQAIMNAVAQYPQLAEFFQTP